MQQKCVIKCSSIEFIILKVTFKNEQIKLTHTHLTINNSEPIIKKITIKNKLVAIK